MPVGASGAAVRSSAPPTLPSGVAVPAPPSPWPWIGGGAGAVLVVLVLIAAVSGGAAGLTIGHLSGAEGQGVELRLSNTSSTDGDVLLFIEQNGHRMCEHVTRMRSGTVKQLTLACRRLAAGDYHVRYRWAASHPLASIATRL